MKKEEKLRISAKIVFITGFFLMSLGSTLLLGTIEGTSRLSVLASFLFFLIGIVLAMLAIIMNRRSVYLFFAAFFLLMGFFLFFIALRIITVPLSRLWPLLSVFAGLALIPAGHHHHRAFKTGYLASAATFIGLGCVFMVFSFKIVPFRFAQFILSWWPILVVMGGLILVLLSLSTGSKAQRLEQ